MDISLNKESLGYLRENTFLFLKKKTESESYYDRRHGYIQTIYEHWEPANTDIHFSAFHNELDEESTPGPEYRLIYIDSIVEDEESINSCSLFFHEIDLDSVDDWSRLFMKCINGIKENNRNQSHFYYMELLWVLNNSFIKMQAFSDALKNLDDISFQLLGNCLQKIGRCLSYQKQSVIEKLLKSYDGSYDIYSPNIVISLYQSLNRHGINGGESDNSWKRYNLFDLIDSIFDSSFNMESIESIDDNIIATVIFWMNNESPLTDYNILCRVFPLLSSNKRIEIVKRYFHDIRLENTNLDISLLEQFKYNTDLEDYVRFRYCIKTPGAPINPSVPLLCDSLITLHRTKGKEFQTFNGVLDLYIMHCNSDYPDIVLNLESYIPKCDGGALINDEFSGFIRYEVIGILKNEPEEKDTNSIDYENKRREILSKFKPNQDGEGEIGQFISTAYEEMFIRTKIRIYPKENIFLGQKWNLLNIDFGGDSSKNTSNQQKDSDQFKKEEAKEVRVRISESIKRKYGVEIIDNEYFELPYNEHTIEEIRSNYYCKIDSSLAIEKKKDYPPEKYLRESYYKLYCSPMCAESKNPALEIPFFWCNGKECFRNVLNKASIKEQLNWKAYSIYHMAEIIGFPKVKETIYGNEVDESVRVFLAIINRAYRLFRRFKCRECGHLLFTSGYVTNYNRINYYCCANPDCSQYKQMLYLNYCHTCKKGIIDSRDTKQCPNGWYICPTCLSCCNDYLYEKQKQLYVNLKRPIPSKISSFLGKGHNDKNQYYCPICGESLIAEGKEFRCLKCNHKFEV